MRALATYGRDGNLYVVMNQAIRSDRNPVEATAFHASDWVLAGDGVEIAATRAIESVLAPGMRTIEFPGVTALPDAEPNLVVRRSSPMVVRTGCQGCGATAVDNAAGEVTLPGIGRPYSLDEPLLISVATGLTLSVDTAEFTDEWGYIEWRVIDENDARVRVDVRIVFDGTGDPESNGENPTALLPTHLFSTSQQNPTPFNPRSFTRSGALQLERVGELINEENQPTAIRLTWVVEWQHAVGERIVLSLDGVTDLGNLD